MHTFSITVRPKGRSAVTVTLQAYNAHDAEMAAQAMFGAGATVVSWRQLD